MVSVFEAVLISTVMFVFNIIVVPFVYSSNKNLLCVPFSLINIVILPFFTDLLIFSICNSSSNKIFASFISISEISFGSSISNLGFWYKSLFSLLLFNSIFNSTFSFLLIEDSLFELRLSLDFVDVSFNFVFIVYEFTSVSLSSVSIKLRLNVSTKFWNVFTCSFVYGNWDFIAFLLWIANVPSFIILLVFIVILLVSFSYTIL